MTHLARKSGYHLPRMRWSNPEYHGNIMKPYVFGDLNIEHRDLTGKKHRSIFHEKKWWTIGVNQE